MEGRWLVKYGKFSKIKYLRCQCIWNLQQTTSKQTNKQKTAKMNQNRNSSDGHDKKKSHFLQSIRGPLFINQLRSIKFIRKSTHQQFQNKNQESVWTYTVRFVFENCYTWQICVPHRSPQNPLAVQTDHAADLLSREGICSQAKILLRYCQNRSCNLTIRDRNQRSRLIFFGIP